MRQIQIRRQPLKSKARRQTKVYDLRTPSGRVLPW
jgi:hypothetical protein